MIVFHQEFAAAVARRLVQGDEATLSLQDFLAAPILPGEGERIILVSSTPVMKSFKKFSARMMDAGREWLLAFLDEEFVFCGPRFGPDHAICLDCFQKRMLSHTGFGEQFRLQLARENYYERNILDQHEGYPPSLAWAVAAFCEDLWSGDDPSRVIRIPVLDEGVTQSRVIAVHGCPQCRAESIGALRFTGHLADMFEEKGLFHGA